MVSTFLIQYSNEIQPGYFATYMDIHLRAPYFYLIKAKLPTGRAANAVSSILHSLRLIATTVAMQDLNHCLCNAMYSVNDEYG